MKKISKIIILLVLIGLWGMLMLNFYDEKEQLNREEVSQYMVLDGHFFLEYKVGKWKNLSEVELADSINWKKFDIFTNDGYYGTYKYVYNNYVSYFFDDDENSVEFNKYNYILINNNSFLKLKDFIQVDVLSEDYDIATKFLKKSKFEDTTIKLLLKYMINDNEYIYIVSNYEDTLVDSDIYYAAFYRKNNKNYLMDKGDFEHNYNLYKVIDVNRDYYNFILSYDCDGICYKMYQYDGDKGYYNVIE